ncbi:MAG: class I SAM-dependent methyltransferase [Bacteroidota bacterium]
MDETKILSAWRQNAQSWQATLAEEEIASRQVTNPAIFSAIQEHQPSSVLDVGCGEGWLLRQLREAESYHTRLGFEAVSYVPMTLVGIDGSEGLIAAAQAAGGADYQHLPYEAASPERLAELGTFDLIVCNYSLFGKDSVVELLAKLRQLLFDDGHLLIQTVHEEVFAGKTGWIEEDWHLMQQQYEGNYHWYLRDRAEWAQTFRAANFQLVKTQETDHPETGKKISFIFHLG